METTASIKEYIAELQEEIFNGLSVSSALFRLYGYVETSVTAASSYHLNKRAEELGVKLSLTEERAFAEYIIQKSKQFGYEQLKNTDRDTLEEVIGRGRKNKP